MNEELQREIKESSKELAEAVEELESYIPGVSGEEGEELAEHVEGCIDTIAEQVEYIKAQLRNLRKLLTDM